MTIPDAAIEAAAEAIHARWDGECFHSEGGSVISCERDARAAIEAAMPALEQHFREAIAQELRDKADEGSEHWPTLAADWIVRGGTP